MAPTAPLTGLWRVIALAKVPGNRGNIVNMRIVGFPGWVLVGILCAGALTIIGGTLWALLVEKSPIPDDDPLA